MKSIHKSVFFLIISTLTNALIIDRQLTGKEDRAQAFYDGIVQRTKDLLNEATIEFKDDEPSTHETNFIIDNRGDGRINIKRESNEILINMKNKYEEFNVASENMNYDTQKDMIDNNFLKPFIEHLGEIVTSTEQAFTIIQNELPNVQVDLGDNSFKVSSVTQLDGASVDAIQFDIGVDGPGMEDGVIGELVNEGSSFKLRMITKYFQNEFILNVRTEHYLRKESNNLMTKILTHMEKMIRLNEGNGGDGPSGEESLDGDKVNQSIQDVLKPLIEDEEFTNEPSDKGITISKDANPILSVSFDTIDVGGFKFINVKCVLPQLDNKEFSQNFLQDSLYQMTGLLDAYLENVMEYTLHSVKSENPSEFVAAFKSEDTSGERILQSVNTSKTMMKKL